MRLTSLHTSFLSLGRLRPRGGGGMTSGFEINQHNPDLMPDSLSSLQLNVLRRPSVLPCCSRHANKTSTGCCLEFTALPRLSSVLAEGGEGGGGAGGGITRTRRCVSSVALHGTTVHLCTAQNTRQCTGRPKKHACSSPNGLCMGGADEVERGPPASIRWSLLGQASE